MLLSVHGCVKSRLSSTKHVNFKLIVAPANVDDCQYARCGPACLQGFLEVTQDQCSTTSSNASSNADLVRDKLLYDVCSEVLTGVYRKANRIALPQRSSLAQQPPPPRKALPRANALREVVKSKQLIWSQTQVWSTLRWCSVDLCRLALLTGFLQADLLSSPCVCRSQTATSSQWPSWLGRSYGRRRTPVYRVHVKPLSLLSSKPRSGPRS